MTLRDVERVTDREYKHARLSEIEHGEKACLRLHDILILCALYRVPRREWLDTLVRCMDLKEGDRKLPGQPHDCPNPAMVPGRKVGPGERLDP